MAISPKNEKVWVSCHDSNGEIHYQITTKSELDRLMYFLWDVSTSPPKKISKAENPLDLNKYIKLKMI